ncbi:SdpI family protein [Litchfieldia alkalitelluris]|uniref:SdpI family protein n=1 Tax=Litchfieldia alkalitelluris TaxID=304268 RepID=UPI0009981DF5|nr:SdpI family protein [Litchfieldia alkalitelluris]
MLNISMAIYNIASGLLFVGISIPLYKERIKMNYLYGVRFSQSFKSDENWYKINKYGAKRMMIWSIPLFIIGVIILFLPPLNEFWMILSLLSPCIVVIPAIESYLFSKKI